MQSLPVLKQPLQVLPGGGIDLDLCDPRQATLFIGQRTADDVLHRAVAWSDDALLRKRVHQFPEDIYGLPADGRHLSSLGLQLLLGLSIEVPIVTKLEDKPL